MNREKSKTKKHNPQLNKSKRNETTSKKEKTPRPKYNMWQNCAFMIRLAWKEKEKKVLVVGLLLACINVAHNLADLYITPAIIGAVETKASLSTLLVTILAFLILTMLFNAVKTYFNAGKVYPKVTLRSAIIGMLNGKIATTSYPNVDDEDLRKMLLESDRAVDNNYGAAEAIWDTMFNLFQNMLGFVIYLVLLTTVNPLLFAVSGVTTAISYFISKPLNEYDYRHRKESGALYESVYDVMHYADDTKMAKDIRLFGMRPWFEEVSAKGFAALEAFYRKAENVYIWGSIADLVLSFARNGIAYAYLIYLVLNGDLSVAAFLLYFSAVGKFTSWVSGILGGLLTLHKQSLELSNIRECLDYPEVFRFEDGETLTPDTGTAYEIRMDNVSFRYPKTDDFILKNINLTLHPGEKLAVVGLNGAGKTTLIKLLCGFLDPTEGRVLLNDRDIRDYNRRDYYKMFSAVFQDFTLLPASVASNVAQEETDIDMALVKECIAKAGLTEKIQSLPRQYETKLNREVFDDAAMLSGGETQRLMLARALYKNAPIVVLDEPTAALDPIAESDLYHKYHEMTRERSSVYISHRLASTRFCDRIILIENGSIAEEGTHEELLAKGGSYSNLFEVQSKYYREEV